MDAACDRLHWCYGVFYYEGKLFVADPANSRLLGWKYLADLRLLHGTDANVLIGQLDFQSKGENRVYGLPMRDSLCWCYGVQVCGDKVAIADSGNNRILLWDLE
ncbi:hypothetical protein ACE1CD_10955 [Aerosakkonema sp. BLCC-F183]|uniref:hypothetical protein n=1 Tax=Aerosakkonema sp. BLCC-F183 TaxID=3342834 RepID=UPI0035B8091C